MNKETIVVCGTGIAGLACALGLTRARFHTSLLGPFKALAQADPDVYYPRVYAISPASQRFLSQLGIWNMLDPKRLTAIESMEIYGDASGQVAINAWQASQAQLAWIVESSEIERALQQAVQVFGIPWHTEKFQQLEASRITTDGGRVLQAELLVGADGASSPVRTAAGIRHKATPYGHIGQVLHLTCEKPHQNTAFQWFTSDGIVALLPLPDTSDGHQVSLVWSMPDALAAEVKTMSEADRNRHLESRLEHISGERLGKLKVRTPLFGFPLTLEHTDMVAPGVALVGDAAHRVHPLAGQGLNLGLGDVEELIKVLAAKEPYRSLGDIRLLRRYRRARAEPVMAMSLATDGLHRLFASQFPPLMLARNVGMQVVDRIPFIKRQLISGAS